MSSRRRTFLELLGGAGIAGLAGCTGSGDEDSGNGGGTETATPTPTPEPVEGNLAGTLPAESIDASDVFGYSVAVSADGRTAVAGARKDEDPNGFEAGAAYVFERSDDGWTQQGHLAPEDGDPGDAFGGGVGVSADGSTALVGAGEDEDPNGENSGSAYVFERSDGDWSQAAKLAAEDGEPEENFGNAVALAGDGTTALVGAYSADVGREEAAGAAYAFERSGGEWSQQERLTLEDYEGDDIFGTSVALGADGSTALVGAIEDFDGENARGSAAVFELSDGTWDQRAKLTADDGDAGDWFGSAVSLSADGSTALVGAEEDDDPNGYDEDYLFGGAGSAYVFQQSGDGWTQQAKLAADDGDPVDAFGWAVALGSNGNLALVGASGDETPDGDEDGGGSAYLFERSGDGWTERTKLAPDDGDEEENVGWAVAMSTNGSTGLVGAPGNEENGADSGAVYVVE